RRNPVIARSAGNGAVEPSGSAVPRNLWARWILRDCQAVAVDAKRADVAVAEVGCIHELVIRGDRKPAELRGQARARIDLHERADAEVAVSIDGSHGASVADGISDDEGIRPAVQEGDVERRAAFCVIEPCRAEGAVLAQGKDGEAIGIWRIRGDRVESA